MMEKELLTIGIIALFLTGAIRMKKKTKASAKAIRKKTYHPPRKKNKENDECTCNAETIEECVCGKFRLSEEENEA